MALRKQFRLELVDNTGFSAEEPVTLRYFKTLEEVPSARESRWVAFIRHAQAGHNVEKALIMNPDNALTDEGREDIDDRDGETMRIYADISILYMYINISINSNINMD